MAVPTHNHSSRPKPALLGMDFDALKEFVREAGFPAFRARQLHHWLYIRGATEFAEMHNLARDFRDWLAENCTIGHATVGEVKVSTDGSKKLIYRLADGKVVESVLIRERNWFTLCVSSQVGCAVDCKFCMTGFGGFQRQMTTAEIVSQVLLAQRVAGKDDSPRNLVFMGMGEPLLNLENLIPALRLLADPDAIGIAGRRITVSTSGILPGIEKLGEANTGVSLAISLNASNNEYRNRIMPINKRYPIENLLDACRAFPLKQRRRITFEYVMLGGENDTLDNARELAVLLRGMPCKINLIPWNPDSHLPFKRPPEDRVLRFQQYLLSQGFTASVRYSKGLDVDGACGQLAAHWREKEKATGK
ncbi:MAG: 23S rRNA (adenine(2503)-C(2))-methyltransferase RlmN [Candidatus Sumerlaeaceae bacterium]|nr:23S rRNA (adenine(2503)-C(2))-methyltransferase RlmN [Candidatus Sumerlaeaceae bacterium]